MNNIEDNIKISNGFDRGIDYGHIKKKISKKIDEIYTKFQEKKKKIDMRRLVFLIVASIQLCNGSRISEAVKAFKLFLTNGIGNRVVVKISKTGAIKVKKDGSKIRTKVRAREMKWPQWINNNMYNTLKKSKIPMEMINAQTLKKRTLDYLLNNFNCNTHSLRYAFINHALYVWNRPINDVAKFVGHANTAQMVTYTQTKNANKIFDLDT